MLTIMKKSYIKYLLFLLSVFFCALIVMPTIHVKVNFKSFHYDKVWQGPTLGDLTVGKFERSFDLRLGSEFEGGSSYTLAVNFGEGQGQDENMVKATVKILADRFSTAGYSEAEVTYDKDQDGNFVIEVYVPVRLENLSDFEDLMTEKGVFDVWGERSDTTDNQQITGGNITLRDLIAQKYNNLPVDFSKVKGTSIGTESGYYYVTIGLTTDQSSGITQELSNYIGKSLAALLDDEFLPINGKDMGSQYQQYRLIHSIRVTGIGDKRQAANIAAVVKNGPIPVDLSILESQDKEPAIGKTALTTGLVMGIGIVFVNSALLSIIFKKNGLATALLLLLSLLYTFALLKVVGVLVSSETILALEFSLAIFIAILIGILVKARKELKDKGIKIELFVRSKEIASFMNFYVAVVILLTLILMLFGPVGTALFAKIFLIATVVHWTIIRYGYQLIREAFIFVGAKGK